MMDHPDTLTWAVHIRTQAVGIIHWVKVTIVGDVEVEWRVTDDGYG